MKKRSKKKEISFSPAKVLLIVIIIAIVASNIFNKEESTDTIYTSELLRSQEYDIVDENDSYVCDENGNQITAVKFDAFFLKDIDGNGYAESIRGTCNEVGGQSTLYMNLSVLEDGYITGTTITIDAKNFYLNTSIVQDNEVAESYISTNTKSISLNDVSVGTQKLMTGYVRSGDYSSTSTKTAAIGNDTTNYSKTSTITISGTYVPSSGDPVAFSREVEITVDWYGEVNSGISLSSTSSSQKTLTKTITDLDSLVTDDGLQLEFTVYGTETLNELILQGSYISGTIPALNGYMPTEVKITGTNVTYTYDEDTGQFTASREAVTNDSEVVTSNAYTGTYSSTRYTAYNFTVIYPEAAYTEMGEDVTSFELSIPVEVYNTGYNNPNEQDGFENPYTSDTSEGTVVITWKKYVATTYSASFNIYVGTYMGSPYYSYVVSKKKPINIYNGISLEETDDNYLVTWRAYTGTNGETAGITMSEQTTNNVDQFRTTSNTYDSMEDVTTNVGIYFSGATSTLGDDGWIKVYDADTGNLIETFTSSNWSSYTSSNPYTYENSVKHIKVETSATNASSYFYVYNVKQLDDEYITENYTREEFDNLSYIYSYLYGSMANENGTTYYSANVTGSALYEAPTSVATIAIKEDTISSQVTAENEKITITTVTSGYNEQGWKNGTFLVKLPEEIILAEINSVTVSNSDVTISAYSIYEEDGNYYIKILTENEEETSYTITIDCDLTADPRNTKTTKNVELYAINETACDYYYSKADTYDLDGDLNYTETVNYRTTTLTMDPGQSLTTVQTAQFDGGSEVIAPRVAKTDKGERTATVGISVTNNYSDPITEIVIQGVIPFEGNSYVISGNDLGSEFTTYLQSTGIVAVTDGLEDYITVYYSTNATPTSDLTDSSNGWTLSTDVTNWEDIKTYLIVLDTSYEIASGETIELEYNITIPDGAEYNETSWAEYAVYFAIDTGTEGKYKTSTASSKVGFMIAKQYDLEITKYQENTTKGLQGITFTITEEGEESSTIATTDSEGKITVENLYAERYYIIQEVKTTDDYVLNDTQIRFYTYVDDTTGDLYIVYDDDGTYYNLEEIYPDLITSTTVQEPNEQEGTNYKIQIVMGNEPKATLVINKTDSESGEVLKNAKFTLSGEGFNSKILTTDSNGEITLSGLYLDEEYTLTEEKLTDYYIPESSIKFTITNDNGEFKVTSYTDNGTTKEYTITTEDELPVLTLNLENEKIPTYSLQITKYATKREEDATGNYVLIGDEYVLDENNEYSADGDGHSYSDTTLEGAQFKIYGEGISDSGKTYTTDASGVITIDNLYEYVEGKYITGIYTISEIYSPEGYTLDSTELKFRAYRDENGYLQIEILEGDSVIRTINTSYVYDSETGEYTYSGDLDESITNAGSETAVIEIGIENDPIFELSKSDENGNPIEGAKFVITDLDDNPVTGSDGKIVGEWSDEFEQYVVTTDSSGKISLNLPEGLYKAVEVYVPDKYVLDSTPQYFGIGKSQKEINAHWYQSTQGEGWDYVKDLSSSDDGGVVAVGSISEYSADDNNGGADVNLDGNIEQTSSGLADGIIVKYDEEGNYEWSSIIGGTDNEKLTKVTSSNDGGFIAVGYSESDTVYYNGTEVSSLAKTSDTAGKDGIIVKISSEGTLEWGVRIGGTLDDEVTSVIETSDKNIAVVGRFYSETLNFYQTGSNTAADTLSLTTTYSKMDGFVAMYSSTGQLVWTQYIGGQYDVEVVDLVETDVGLAVAVNYSSTVYLNKGKTTSQGGQGTGVTDGLVAEYDLSTGSYLYRYRFASGSSSYNIEISSIDVNSDGNILVAVEYANYIRGYANGSSSYTTIASSYTTNYAYDATIIELTNTCTYVGQVYTISGNYDDYISSIKTTSDGGILLGGWTYSTTGVDFDLDGTDDTLEGTYTSDGFIVQLDESGNTVYSNRVYGDGYDSVTAVTELDNGTLVAGGTHDSSELYASSFDGNVDVKLFTQSGNSDGFIIAEGENAAEVPEKASLEIENKIKSYKITTEVIKHDEDGVDVAGGSISGTYGFTLDDVEYTEDGIHYVESVDYQEDGTQTITITPDANYVISKITINGEEYTSYTLENDGTVTISAFTSLTEDIHVTVTFSNTISNVVVNHYLWTGDETTSTTQVADTEVKTGTVGDTYDTLPNTDIDYDIITNEDYYGSSTCTSLGLDPDGYYIPSNYAGTYEEGTTIYVNYFYKEKTYTLTVYHYLAGTETPVPAKDDSGYETVPSEETTGLTKNYEYETEQAADTLIDYDIYKLVETPANATGYITENTVVIYEYQIRTVDLRITKVAEEDYSTVLTGTEFSLYQLIGTDDESLIDPDNLDTENWALFGTYTTNSLGLLKLEDLPVTSVYRLVETKASEGRMISEGQWKIEIITGDYDTTDTSIVTVNGVAIRITAIGNPPAIALTEERKSGIAK